MNSSSYRGYVLRNSTYRGIRDEEVNNKRIRLTEGDELKELVDGIEEVLGCPVCLEKLRPPVLSCENGHGTCSQCRHNLNSCSICSADFSNTSMRMVEQVLHLLPEPCPYTSQGCSSLALTSHSQCCEYRPIKCVLGSDYSCKWAGMVKDWISHAKLNHIVLDYSDTSGTRILTYEHFSKWIVRGSCHFFDNEYFIVFARKKNGMLQESVRHVPLGRTNWQYFLETTIKKYGSLNVLYRVVLSTGLLLENDSFENNSTSFALQELEKDAVVH